MSRQLPPEVLEECRFICKGYSRRKRALANKLAQCHNDPTPADMWGDAELLKLMAVRHALEQYDKETAAALILNLEKQIPYEHLVVPMGRQMFYRQRKQFLCQVAEFMGY